MKTVQAIVVTVMLSIGLFLPGIAQAFEIDLYQTLDNTESGTACNICSILELPEDVYSGYVVILNTLGSLIDPTTWSNVVVFGSNVVSGVLQGTPGVTLGDMDIQLLAKGCSSGIATDISCFPTYAQVTAGLYAQMIITPPVTEYDANPNVYRVHTLVASVPEPSSLLLLGSGLAAVGLWRRHKVKS